MKTRPDRPRLDPEAIDFFGRLLARHEASRLLRPGDRVEIHCGTDVSTGLITALRGRRAEVERVDGTRRWQELWQLWLVTDTIEAANRFLAG